jgi:preprotein translocase subunit SecE
LNFVSNLKLTLIWLAVVGVVFAILWWQGQLVRLSNYIQQTREELRKCTWPTWNELIGSTVLVAITILLLGGFTSLVNLVFGYLVSKLT